MRYVGLCGAAGAGKTTVAMKLASCWEAQAWNNKAVIIPFAKPLKELARSFGWDGQKDDKGRKFLQMIGTEVGRAYDNNHWVWKWLEEVDKYRNINPIVNVLIISDDVRFDNEAKVITDLGGMNYKIYGSYEYDLGDAATHASEVGVSEHLLKSLLRNSSQSDLDNSVQNIMEFLW